MKNKIIFSALLVVILSVGFNSKTDAAPWRGRFGFIPPVVRVIPPVRAFIPPILPPVVVGGYYGPRYCPAPVVVAPHYGYGYRGYGHRYYR